jgi:adenine-specific DNA-methyltransferase
MEQMDKNGLDLTKVNIEKLKAIFPECVSDGKIDFDMLKLLLGGEVDNSQEKYSFNWVGKADAIKYAQTPSTATLLPCKEKSVNWETTKNLFIEGDNLEVLKTLTKTYHSRIKMVYIDPPYNTGKDFVYHDDYQDNIEHYLEQTNQAMKSTPETAGRYHTDWLNMIYLRLKLAYDLLSNKGFCFIHIDEHEDYNLRKICNSIFGENNELGVIIWDKRNPKGETVGVAYQHESILVYAKDKESISNSDFTKKKENAEEILKKAEQVIKNFGGINDSSRSEFKKWVRANAKLTNGEAAYCLIDNFGRVYRQVSMAAPDKPETRSHRPLLHPVTKKPCPTPAKGWRFTDETMDKMIKDGKIDFGIDETTQPTNKYYLDENIEEMFPSVLYYGGSDDALGMPFDNPKPVYIAKKLIYSVCKNDDDIVIDFFAGSGTTAQAVMELNAEDGIKRHFILVQLPENLDANLENGNNTNKELIKKCIKLCNDLGEEHYLTAISEERVRRAAVLVEEDAANKKVKAGLLKDSVIDPDSLDFGFKVFKLDSTNIQPWDATKKYDSNTIFELMDVVKEGRSNLDVAYEVMLKYGVFNMPLEEVQANGKTVYSVGSNYMIISLNDEVTSDDVLAIAKLEPKAVVFKESGFKDDNEKMNAEYTFKRLGIDNVKCI